MIGYIGYCLIDSNFYVLEELLNRNWRKSFSSRSSSVNSDVIEYEVNPSRLNENTNSSCVIDSKKQYCTSSMNSTVMVDITVQLNSTSADMEAADNMTTTSKKNDNEKKHETTSSIAILQDNLFETIKAKSM